MYEDIQEAFAVFREMMDDFENWYPYDADDTEDDKQDAIDSFARAKLNLELGEYSEWELDYLSWLWRKPIENERYKDAIIVFMGHCTKNTGYKEERELIC